ncbi:hypothetical protein GT037_000016 [Alternaria burnsii]|uniref:Uncharacterized protein n=1 Tax=Alternaria burnsii TaxID=1187904 RepID=A0A8H7EK30_9PLEO|nr:uncharacterized protein GT037_000016 [Alternaria burnsii]KAF7681040.1 hypothetical protein GT037_000016 [Alternaria burnsii]CAI9633216.1 unnamed protein product [Alternaria burnsii]
MAPAQSLLLLSGASVVLLWGTMLINGTLDGVSLAAKHGYFPDGRPLRQTFTGYPSVDGNLVVVVAFFDMLITARDVHAPRWLFFEMCNVLGAINTWVLIESRRRGVRSFLLRHIVFFMFLWNMAGAAVVTPLFFCLLAKSAYTTRDCTIPLNEARGFPPTLVVNALFPVIMYAASWLGWSAHTQQSLVAWYHLNPMLMIVTVVLASRPGTSLTQFETPKRKSAPDEDAPWIVASLVATGVLSAAVHVSVVLSALAASFTRNTDLGILRLYVPSPRSVFAQPRGSMAALVEGAHLFTQFDWIIVAAACFIITNHLLEKSAPRLTEKAKKTALLWNLLGTVALGPGAAGSFALAVRENRMRAMVPAVKTM